jgi:hypothetical protein
MRPFHHHRRRHFGAADVLEAGPFPLTGHTQKFPSRELV